MDKHLLKDELMRINKFIFFIVFSYLHISSLLLTNAYAQGASSSDIYQNIRKMRSESKNTELIAYLEKLLEGELKSEDKKMVLFASGYFSYQAQNIDKSKLYFESLLSSKTEFDEFAHYYLGLMNRAEGKFSEAKLNFKKIADLNPNFKTKWDAQIQLAEIAIEEKKYKDARKYLVAIEKKLRGDERYSQILKDLLIVDKAINNRGPACKWAKKLYAKFPAFEGIKEWNEKGDAYCSYSIEDSRTRIKNLQWAGQHERAKAEAEAIKARVIANKNPEESFEASRVEAQFLAQEGELEKALSLLKPYSSTYKNNVSFLLQLASVAARAGEMQIAVDSYYQAYKLAPRGKNGRKSLYQAAFLSYQFQDYEGASTKFKEFISKYSRSGLAQDAKWHLAWITYLKGDYENALKSMSNLSQKSRRGKKISQGSDRNQYWMAMSHLKLGRVEVARKIFETLSRDRSHGYYSLLAKYRLSKLPPAEESSSKRVIASEFPKRITRFMEVETLIASADITKYTSEELESEENIVLDQEETEPEAISADESSVEAGAQVNSEEVAEEDQVANNFQNPVLMKRFERSRELMMLGLSEHARWDLWDIEKKTSNKDYLKTLMSEYEVVENYNRSSYIAQISFGPQRVAYGIEGVRHLWESAYPKAYSEFVTTSAKSFDIPYELVYGIMRAESQYKKDAVSPVGALGLMQVMPNTGIRVASMLGIRDFKANKLLEPEWAIKIGSRYLSRLMRKFNNNVALTAAGYNAGPHRVLSWVKSFGNLELDEFVEHIPYLETRNYVKRVTANYNIYTNLYGGKKDSLAYLVEPLSFRYNDPVPTKETWEEI